MIIFDLANGLEVSTLAAAGGLLHGIPEARTLILLLKLGMNLLDKLSPLRHLARRTATHLTRLRTTTRCLASRHVVF